MRFLPDGVVCLAKLLTSVFSVYLHHLGSVYSMHALTLMLQSVFPALWEFSKGSALIFHGLQSKYV